MYNGNDYLLPLARPQIQSLHFRRGGVIVSKYLHIVSHHIQSHPLMDMMVRTYIGQHRYIESGTYKLRSLIRYIECEALMYLVLCTYLGLCRYVLSHSFTDVM